MFSIFNNDDNVTIVKNTGKPIPTTIVHDNNILGKNAKKDPRITNNDVSVSEQLSNQLRSAFKHTETKKD